MTAFVSGLLLLPLLGIAGAWLGLFSSGATSTPPRWETRFSEKALRASLARRAGTLKNPLAVSSETLLAGMKIFRTNCAGCHGEAGQPSYWGTTSFYPRVPQFADVPPTLSAPEMFYVVKNGIRYTGMGAWDGMLSDVEIWQVVTFLNSITSLPEEVGAEWKTKH